jgi:hypothetical protein
VSDQVAHFRQKSLDVFLLGGGDIEAGRYDEPGDGVFGGSPRLCRFLLRHPFFTDLRFTGLSLGVNFIWHLILQLLLMPVYLFVFAGSLVPIQPLILAESVLLVLVVPLMTALSFRKVVLYLFQLDPRIIEANTAADGINHTRILEGWINPHCGVGMDSLSPSWFTFDHVAVDSHVRSACRPLAEAK